MTERQAQGLERRQITAAIDELEARGPALGRPFVDRIKGSRHHKMKELRSIGGNIRVLLAFDPNREAILLIGGDKTEPLCTACRRADVA